MSSNTAEDRRILLRHPDLRRYLAARFLVGMATQIQTVAVGWQVFCVSGDPFDLGLVALSQFLPFILLILPAGHVADRYDRRRVQLLTYLLLAVCAVALLALSLSDVTDTTPVFGVMVLFGIARAFNQPTGQALLPNLAPIGLFPRAVAANSSLGQVATIAGPALGGALVLVGVEAAYALSVVLLVGGVLLVSGLRGGGREERSSEPVSWSTLLSGINFVRSRSVVLGSISLDLFAVLSGDMVSVYIRHLLVQLETPDEIRGRVSAVNSVFIGASNELGEFESGVTAAWWGVVPAVVIGSGATVAVAVAWSRLFPVLRRLDRFPQPSDAPPRG